MPKPSGVTRPEPRGAARALSVAPTDSDEVSCRALWAAAGSGVAATIASSAVRGSINIRRITLLRHLLVKNWHLWLGGWVAGAGARRRVRGPRHLLFAFCDHFEPLWKTS